MYLNALNIIAYDYYKKLFKLLKYHNWNSEYIWKNLTKLNLQKFGFTCDQVQKILKSKSQIDPEGEYKDLLQQEVTLVPYNSPLFPIKLKQIPDPPFLVYVKGQISNCKTISIVGTRVPTQNGLKAVDKFVSELSPYKLSIVSGLAYGVDAKAHISSINHKIHTGAVLGCGLENVYPSNHQRLSEQIIELGGFLMSEFPLKARPTKYSFPRRNRIISGLSDAVIVVEAGKKSGALITAQYALSQNRDVLVVPGSIFEKNYQGSNELLRQGAFVMTEAKDLLNLQSLPLNLTPIQKLVYNTLNKRKFKSHQEISNEIPQKDLSNILLDLEVQKIIISDPLKGYKINS